MKKMNEEKWNDETHEEHEIDIEIEEHEGEKPHKMMKRFLAGPRGHGSPFDLEEGFFPPGKHHKVIKRRGGSGAKKFKKKKHRMVQFLKDEDGNRLMYITLPGIDKSSLSVKAKKRAVLIESNYLTDFQKIYGEKTSDKIRLPFLINPDKIDAEYKTGILKLTFHDVDALDPAVQVDVSATDD